LKTRAFYTKRHHPHLFCRQKDDVFSLLLRASSSCF
jgi:hypothetical protein